MVNIDGIDRACDLPKVSVMMREFWQTRLRQNIDSMVDQL
jgi:hypothetical protein